MNLRNAPVDKRRLKASDRNFDTSRRETALKRAKQRRGALAYAENQEMRTTAQAPGSGGFTQEVRASDLKTRLNFLKPSKALLSNFHSIFNIPAFK